MKERTQISYVSFACSSGNLQAAVLCVVCTDAKFSDTGADFLTPKPSGWHRCQKDGSGVKNRAPVLLQHSTGACKFPDAPGRPCPMPPQRPHPHPPSQDPWTGQIDPRTGRLVFPGGPFGGPFH